jgi:sigma-E factor negative regulatory protein RseA
MVMATDENISRLMDGELDDDGLEAVCGQLKRADGMDAWACYHVIGDALRGTDGLAPGFGRRFAARLAAEPTVLAPRARPRRAAAVAWAAAASIAAVAVVGTVAYSTLDMPPAAMAMAKAREASTVRAAQVRPQGVPADYVLAHQEYSPAATIQGIGPQLRAVAAPAADARP